MNKKNKTIRVLVVDDSAVVRKVLLRIFAPADDIEVVGTAPDPIAARELIVTLKPDVVTLDVEMPKMDGITFLRELMRTNPLPVVMLSSLVEAGAELTVQALEIGAVDFITKPRIDQVGGMESYGREVRRKVRVAAGARVRAFVPAQLKSRLEKVAAAKPLGVRGEEGIIAIGASTGGVEAVREIIAQLPASMPGIVVAQHIPNAFVGPLAARLDQGSELRVKVAENGEPILPGHVYLAPGDRHLLVERDAHRYLCRLSEGPPVRHYRPSIDLLFYSVALSAGERGMGVILTGMGDDGVAGLLEMRNSGARTLVQDEATSVVWGMPSAAIDKGAVEVTLALPELPLRLIELSRTSTPNRDA